MRKVILVCLAASVATVAVPASAAMTLNGDGSLAISSDTTIGDSYTFTFDGSEDGSTIDGLTSALTLIFNGTSGNHYLLGYSLENTSGTPLTSSAVTAFGFNVDPNAILSGSGVSGFFGTVASGQASQGYNLEICFKNGQANNCAGSPGNQGVNMGNTGTGIIDLAFAGSLPQFIRVSDPLVRYQAIDGPGMRGGSAIGTPVTSAVPEPSTWALLLVGFAAVGFAMRRRKVSSQVRRLPI